MRVLDLEFVYDKLTGNEADYGNWFSDIMEKGKEYISEDLAPIYLDPDDEGKFAYWDSAWWAKNSVSIGSALSILVPVAGYSSLMRGAGKGLGLLSKSASAGRFGKGMSKSGNYVDDIITAHSKLKKSQPWMQHGPVSLCLFHTECSIKKYHEALFVSTPLTSNAAVAR